VAASAPTPDTSCPGGASATVVWHPPGVSRAQRWERLGLSGATVWLTGLSGSGKSTVAAEIERQLVAAGRATCLLDGDNLRLGLNADLGFSAADRHENVRRVGEVAALLADAGLVAIVPLISPYRAGRDAARAAHGAKGLRFVEVWMDTPIDVCEARDPKGLYARARAGEITGFTGVDDPYEPPDTPELTLRADATRSASDLAAEVVAYLGATTAVASKDVLAT
jgi:bifunctional enzyme CysN/CysC